MQVALLLASKRSKSSYDGCWVAKSRITCVNTNGNTTLTEAQGVSLRITPGVRFRRRPPVKGVGLCVVDSHTGNHPENDFTPLATIRRSYSIIRKRIPFELEGETFEPERGMTTFAVMCKACCGEPSVDLLRYFLNLGRAGDWLTLSNKGGADVPKALIKPVTHLENWKDPVLYLAGLNTSWEYSPKRPVIYHRGQGTGWSFMIQGVDGEFNFLPEGGFEDNQGSFSANSVNNETPILDAEPISDVLPTNVADNIIDSSNTFFDDELPPVHPTSTFPRVGEKSKATGKRKLVVDTLREGSHRKARRAPVHVSKVVGDASTPLDVDSDPDIHEFPSARELNIEQLYDIHGRAYMCQAVLDYMLNIRTIELISALHKARASCDAIREREEIDRLRQDRVAIITKVVPDAAMKLFHSDEMGVLIARLVRETIVHGRCMEFEEIAKLKEPFILEKMPSYRMSSKDKYDQAEEDMANASFPLLSKFTSNPYASVEKLLSIKPRSLRSSRAP
nr:hypothetical protein [Tanacetum cinerariifolium]